jgi:hypothetical protein
MSDERPPDRERPPEDERGGEDERSAADERPTDDAPRAPRPLIERIGLGLIAMVMAVAFGGAAVAAWIGGEVFLAAMGAIGCLMTAWVGGLTVLRG